MTSTRWLLSLFFVWHIVATLLGSIGSPDEPILTDPPRHPTTNRLSAAVTPALDRLANPLSHFPSWVPEAARPVYRVARLYLSLTGVSQSWKMFSHPPMVYQYLRVRYYVADNSSGGASNKGRWRATELVLPGHREDQVRLVRGYLLSSRDKAMTVALSRHHDATREYKDDTEVPQSRLPRHLAPIGRYFARRFQRTHLRPTERIVRTEVWYGIAEVPPPGTPHDPEAIQRRRDTIIAYYDGPVTEQVGAPQAGFRAAEQEGPIIWILEYFE